MAWKLAPAIEALRKSVNAEWPARDKQSDGTIGDRAHASRKSDHNPDGDEMVCALDITHDPDGGPTGDAITAAAMRDARTKYVIWNGRIFYGTCRDHGDCLAAHGHRYTGSNPHDKHAHVSVTQAGKRDSAPWALAPVNTPKPAPAVPAPATSQSTSKEALVLKVWYVPGDDARWAVLYVGQFPVLRWRIDQLEDLQYYAGGKIEEQRQSRTTLDKVPLAGSVT